MKESHLPLVPTDISEQELRVLSASRVDGKVTSTGYRFVCARAAKTKPGQSHLKDCQTYRVKLKKPYNARGESKYEEFSGRWESPREAARFVAGLFRQRYGANWPEKIRNGRPPVWDIFQDVDEPGKWWLIVWLQGKRVPVDNHRSEEGCFYSEQHARWYLREWANAKFPVSGLSALGFESLPDDTREDFIDDIPKEPARFSYHWVPMLEMV
jgi:hypothetical protein